MKEEFIRNFCIVAHIDHGKSTLADRFLEETHIIGKGTEVSQILDSMDLEREKGITIKSHAVRMVHNYQGQDYVLNLIDTPGHVDFSYEVSRALASCEGAILLVDASQGIEAQTMSNLYLALDNNLEILPVINKIDLPKADIEGTENDLCEILGCLPEEIIKVSAKTGEGVKDLLDAIVTRLPAPKGNPDTAPRALIFDSYFDMYRGVVVLVRVFEGKLQKGDKIKLFSTAREYEIEEIGYLGLKFSPQTELTCGEAGYIIANIKEVADARVGDTITLSKGGCENPLPGFREPKPMVYSSIFPINGEDYENLVESIAKLKLNDASLIYEKESSAALGYGFRCGFLGMLHLEIVKERLLREYNIPIMATTPSVRFLIKLKSGEELQINNPVDFPDPSTIESIMEPFMDTEIIVPTDYIGNVLKLVQERRGIQKDIQYIDEKRVTLHYELPLIEIIFDFYDKLKTVSRGYASLDYTFKDYRETDVVKVDILINGEKVDAMSFICHQDKAYNWGKSVTETLAEVIPKHLFKIALQAAIGGKIIARSTINPLRKDVLAKCYGGDVSRKRKLLEKQKEGKKKMKEIGSVSVPQEAFLAVLKADRE
ncbi:translation elongation factor 4 [Candidatus Cloacimonas acidaminovorans]|jgi:GTP-binding protein LepA|uniref:Elongation factor 4 n=1 Tax=Cloacimonas acidaminovorans (strain Evry) TaxID=459349 RepID=B0VIW4_CLOAI|nr:translation elongation factor 4 [Candidatus Cloacimonas acidaminovorans]CAO80024.1 GTP-binding membrane protein [Candidatus Cloacimonas acidaminovorans str. Evry]HPI41935.1 translation elongation factor 4 [Candidatus Cloacimonas acidaminovorans]HPV00178.1 translation elongation factor 4 [Candidatus Cloacimonas acidaminovorans]HQF34806.1 translation elongation factor 4 [Candidatus Cloacimonas acidaminovorans]HQI52737.1 translation elongation factor 4 [Candidatus Cloacimonas acidaminovorans]